MDGCYFMYVLMLNSRLLFIVVEAPMAGFLQGVSERLKPVFL
jgi:hypothetical protein